MDHTPYFPENITDYAPWVATHGLTAPYGECQCGCGQKTNLSRQDNEPLGAKRGRPYRFRAGHGSLKYKNPQPPNPSGLCICGCGQITPISRKTNHQRGRVKGAHLSYVPGHSQHTIYGTTEEVFWSQVDRRGPDECWEWKGVKAGPYGLFCHNNIRTTPHRFAYELHHGPIPEGKHACHDCPMGDNPLCCNWAHLWAGTAAENIADKMKKNRQAKGESIGTSKLTAETVLAIRQRFGNGIRQYVIAKEFGITPQLVFNIVHRRSWQHI